jgi:hypothetical protein
MNFSRMIVGVVLAMTVSARAMAELSDRWRAARRRRQSPQPAPRTFDGKPISGIWQLEAQLPLTVVRLCGRTEFRDLFASSAAACPISRGPRLVKSDCVIRKTTRWGCVVPEPNYSRIRHRESSFNSRAVVILSGRRQPAISRMAALPGIRNRRNGYSTGKWEGDAFVVETIGFRDGICSIARAAR